MIPEITGHTLLSDFMNLDSTDFTPAERAEYQLALHICMVLRGEETLNITSSLVQARDAGLAVRLFTDNEKREMTRFLQANIGQTIGERFWIATASEDPAQPDPVGVFSLLHFPFEWFVSALDMEYYNTGARWGY
jgi:hypothetical protein